MKDAQKATKKAFDSGSLTQKVKPLSSVKRSSNNNNKKYGTGLSSDKKKKKTTPHKTVGVGGPATGRIQGPLSKANQPEKADDRYKELYEKLMGNYSGLQSQLSNMQKSWQDQQSSTREYIDRLNEAKKAQTLANLDKSRNAALSNLQQEKSGIQPMYYDARNQEAARKQQDARNFAEFMAARGGASSGSNAQAELSRNNAFQGNIGALNRQEAQANQNIARRQTDVQNAYQSDAASAQAGIEAQRMQALINQMNQDRQFGLQEAGLMGSYNGAPTLSALNANRNFALSEAGLTGQYNGAPTFQAQQFNANQDWRQQQFDYQQNRDQVGDQKWQDQFVYQQIRDQIGDERWRMEFEEDSRRFGLNYAMDKQVSLGNLSLSQARLAQQQSELAYRKQQDSIDNQYRQEMFEYEKQQANNPQPQDYDLGSIAKQIDSSPYLKEGYGTIEVTDQQGLENYILSMGLPDRETEQLYSRYGLPIPK